MNLNTNNDLYTIKQERKDLLLLQHKVQIVREKNKIIGNNKNFDKFNSRTDELLNNVDIKISLIKQEIKDFTVLDDSKKFIKHIKGILRKRIRELDSFINIQEEVNNRYTNPKNAAMNLAATSILSGGIILFFGKQIKTLRDSIYENTMSVYQVSALSIILIGINCLLYYVSLQNREKYDMEKSNSIFKNPIAKNVITIDTNPLVENLSQNDKNLIAKKIILIDENLIAKKLNINDKIDLAKKLITIDKNPLVKKFSKDGKVRLAKMLIKIDKVLLAKKQILIRISIVTLAIDVLIICFLYYFPLSEILNSVIVNTVFVKLMYVANLLAFILITNSLTMFLINKYNDIKDTKEKIAASISFFGLIITLIELITNVNK